MKKRVIAMLALSLVITTSLCACSKLEDISNNTEIKQDFGSDLSFTGEITEDNGQLIFISDQMYELNNNNKDKVNQFIIENEEYESLVDQHGILKCNSITNDDSKMIVDPQFFVGKDIVIPTPFVDLHFSSEWSDYLVVKKTMEGESYNVQFSAEVDGEQYPLYTVAFGSCESEPIGKIVDAMNNMTVVYLEIADTDISKVSDELQDVVLSMKDNVNYTTEKLKKSTGFDPEV